ncbi:hypothetical protein PP747_gp084 [Rhizobium phage RHph_Y38]|uniref:Uncharacterized protein n=2 Tax=Acanvirus TaxID=3044653 RepID=A0A7S5URG3_9CAUD|nr:hypothetical protein PP747_gp084 [Rhizobium phage RHph_Y38]YP_010658293.1 hypothetical protein PP749_gp082 [Rhizobium phage RHEph22]QIG67785.1 hypothetical protein EVB52_084 [Rhizobium phage RHph_Y38]QXV74755.1 hypothetical protein [Rhizobium phage RHEph22]QXV74849.1 hypothetical protein [Rhizobium phage RHEph24]
MSEIQSNIEQTEERIAVLKVQIALRDRLLRLQNNSDFTKLINEEFLVKEAARFVQLSQDPALPNDEARRDALQLAQATGHLKRWFSAIITMGNVAERDLRDNEALIEELRAAGDAE